MVGQTLTSAAATAQAWAEATSEEEAQTRLSELVADNPSASGPGAPWILEHCQVDLAT